MSYRLGDANSRIHGDVVSGGYPARDRFAYGYKVPPWIDIFVIESNRSRCLHVPGNRIMALAYGKRLNVGKGEKSEVSASGRSLSALSLSLA